MVIIREIKIFKKTNFTNKDVFFTDDHDIDRTSIQSQIYEKSYSKMGKNTNGFFR